MIRWKKPIQRSKKEQRKSIYSYIVNEVKPVLTELGIPTPEELGYDKPEFFITQPDVWWEKNGVLSMDTTRSLSSNIEVV
ncbi:hypothetical protein COOONC_00155 [Cooperia oncophora]